MIKSEAAAAAAEAAAAEAAAARGGGGIAGAGALAQRKAQRARVLRPLIFLKKNY